MGTWNDVYFRVNDNDQGDCPVGGCLSSCFDIITKKEPIADPSVLIKEDLNKNNSENLVARMNNRIYVRGKNLAGKEQSGKVFLYYSPASLLLYPSIWQNNIIKTAGGSEHFNYTVANDSYFVSSDDSQGCFIWNPEVITNDHYCLVSRSVTEDHPAPIPPVSDVRDFGNFISNNRSYGWRNVTVIDSGSPTFSITVDYEQGTKEEDMHFILSCQDLPVGSEVAIDCPNPGPNPPISMNKTKITEKNQDLGVKCHVPANFKGKVTYHYWSNGGIPGDNFSITLHCVIFVHGNDELFQYAKHHEELGFSFAKNTLNELKLGSTIGPEYGIILGQYKTEGKK